jgi:hypothetical protein
MREKSSYSFLRSLVKGRDHSFLKISRAYFVSLAVLLFRSRLVASYNTQRDAEDLLSILNRILTGLYSVASYDLQ